MAASASPKNLPNDTEAVHEINAKMRAFIESMLPDGDWSVPVEADRIFAEVDTRLLDEWLWANARTILADYLQDRRQNRRAEAMRVLSGARRKSVFEHYRNNPDASPFDLRFIVSDDNVSRRLGDMTRDDINYVVAKYADRVATLERNAAFLTELARKVKGDKTVRESMDEATVTSVLAKHFEAAA